MTHQQSPRPGLSSACVLPQAAADYDPCKPGAPRKGCGAHSFS
uniref:Uncharacterized protein n=1 Tax=Siphoviridae sp. cttWj13 TaxID=2826494 RepID=A0A8S5QXP9_9CAUD|nr:MAG TPA: hypothetical protein [Siphoviridae sp. cttWj13]